MNHIKRLFVESLKPTSVMAMRTSHLGEFLQFRTINTTITRLGRDLREWRIGSKPAPDTVTGENLVPPQAANTKAYELIDENLQDRVINNMLFKNIPVITIRCTRNNTKVHLHTYPNQLLATKTCGMEGYKHCRKGTTVAATAVAKRVLSIANDHDINTVRIVFNGLGPGRDAAYKVFESSGINIVSLSDRTQAAEPWNLRPRKVKRL